MSVSPDGLRTLVATAVDPESSAAAQEAFGELVRRFQDAAFAYAFAILRERTAAEDAVQAAFLNAWLHRRELVEPAAFGGWLRMIVRTECHRIIRRPQPTIVPLDEIELPAIDASEKNLLTRELRRLLLKAIIGLTDADRTVILLKYASDLSYEDIAHFLDVPVSTVKKRLHVARRRLRASLERLTLGELSERVFDEYRPSRNPDVKKRIMTSTDFLEKIAFGDVSAVTAALDAQPSLVHESGPARMWTGSVDPLTIAAASGRPAIVRVLIARGASVATRPGRPSLVVSAAIEGHREVVDALVAAGAEVDIFAACALGDVDKVAALLTDHPLLVHSRADDSKTPLHFARTEDVAERLIRAGAELNVEDDSGQTPLQWMAATGRYKSLVSYLKSQGARAESSDIFWACVYGDIAAVRTFLERDRSVVDARRSYRPGIHPVSVGFTPLHEASVRGEDAIVKLLIEYGADVNALGGRSRGTALHAAAAVGHASTADILLESGADPRAKDGGVFEATPDHWAKSFGHADLADRLRRVASRGTSSSFPRPKGSGDEHERSQ
jgi:RNA polymerase sigma factor (sigma-70 family)